MERDRTATGRSTYRQRLQRGASGLGYALVIGLVSVLAVGSIDSVGEGVTSLFGEVDSTLDRRGARSPEPAVPTNSAPVARTASLTVTEDTPRSFTVADFGSDPDAGDAVESVTVTGFTGQGVLIFDPAGVADPVPGSRATIDASDLAQLSYTPPANVSGAAVASISFTLSDGQASSAPGTLSLDITAENDPPVAVDDNVTTDQNTPTSGTDLLADNGNGADSDPDGDTPTVALVNGSAAAVDPASPIVLPSGATLDVSAAGTFVYDPNGAFPTGGSDSFTYVLTDGALQGNTATASITITDVNDAPSFTGTVPGPNTAVQNSPMSAITLSAFTDVDGDSLTFSLSDAGSGIANDLTVSESDTLGNPGDTSDGTAVVISGTPTQSGTFTLTVTADDGRLGVETVDVSLTVNAPVGGVVSQALCAQSGQIITTPFTTHIGSTRTMAFEEDGDLWILDGSTFKFFAFDAPSGTWTYQSGNNFTKGSTDGVLLGAHMEGNVLTAASNGGWFYQYNVTTGAEIAATNVSNVSNAQGIASSDGGASFYMGSYSPAGQVHRLNSGGARQSSCTLTTQTLRGATHDPTTGNFYFASSSTVFVESDPSTCNSTANYERTHGSSQDIGYFSGFVFEQLNDGSMKAVPAQQNTVCD